MTRFATLLCLTLCGAAAPAMADGSWTWTGENGATATGTRNCTGAIGAGYSCTGQSTYVGPNGWTANNNWNSAGNANGGQRTGTTTGQNGETRTRTFTWQRN